MRNWAGNIAYDARQIHFPASLQQVRELVVQEARIKPLGTRHSFNEIADTDAVHLSLRDLDRIVRIDRTSSRPTVTVEAGITYGALCGAIHKEGLALHNLASLPHISVGGACATATHGSGDRNGVLASAVAAMQIVTADGEFVELSCENDAEEFRGAVVGLGALGVVTQLTLNLSPSFQMRQEVFLGLPFSVVTEQFDAIFSSAYSVSLFTEWRSSNVDQIWIKRRISDGDQLRFDPAAFGARRAESHLHPLRGCSAENCTEQLGLEGAWYERLPHFRMDFTPSAGEELQSEYLVPREHALTALETIDQMRERISPLLQVSEIRSIAADDLWMSPCYRQPCVGIHFTWKKDWEGVKKVLPEIEQRLNAFDARPHWGKLFTMPAQQVQKKYPKLDDFRKLMRQFDPKGKFSNRFLQRYLLR